LGASKTSPRDKPVSRRIRMIMERITALSSTTRILKDTLNSNRLIEEHTAAVNKTAAVLFGLHIGYVLIPH
jgi:hypothetical protein